MVKDLTIGSPAKSLIKFSLPLIVATIFQQLYNLADSIIAGNVLGVDALSATSVSFPVTMVYVAIALGGSAGASVVIARHMGAKEYGKMKTAVFTAMTMTLVLSAVLMLMGELLCTPILKALNTEDKIFNDSASYLRIYTFGVAFVLLYNAATAAFTAMGDSRAPLILLICSSVLNVGLDLIFTVDAVGIRLGVSGLAWATFIAQGIACLTSLIWLFIRLRKIRITEGDDTRVRPFSLPIALSICRIAVPSVVQQLFIPVGQMFVQSIINGFGSAVIAGYNSAVKVNTLCIACNNMMSNAVSSFTAQNLGADKPDRVRKGLKSAVLIVALMDIFFIAISLSLSRYLIALFADSSDAQFEAMVAAGKQFLVITSPFYIVVGVKLVLDGMLRGSGKMLLFMIGTVTDLIIRVIFSFILSPSLGFLGICWSYPIGWALGISATITCFIIALKQIKRKSSIPTLSQNLPDKS
ncbi:MAG: MATE family efflux transporter [Clostridia bacterium]|nr:MATE family efflux transporter [Clostridia bacterium]